MTRLQEHYQKTVVPALMEQFKYSSAMQVPRITKITLNMGVGESVVDKKAMEGAVDDLTKIAGQKPIVTKARKSVAAFKIRDGWPIGCKVTLRRDRMYEFLDRLIALALPRVRDFRGLKPKAFDGRGNYSLGLSEQLVFPELNPDKYPITQGMNIALVTSTFENSEARLLLEGFGLPLQSETEETANAS